LVILSTESRFFEKPGRKKDPIQILENSNLSSPLETESNGQGDKFAHEATIGTCRHGKENSSKHGPITYPAGRLENGRQPSCDTKAAHRLEGLYGASGNFPNKQNRRADKTVCESHIFWSG
jgi:hypothetical protein